LDWPVETAFAASKDGCRLDRFQVRTCNAIRRHTVRVRAAPWPPPGCGIGLSGRSFTGPQERRPL
ncbi:hypothetical protein, partial [Glycomyces tenuis]|uniref:hypothetical protein n=1 Tax=Glycomyces tenuis TaxID=58116 RepID=UPI0005531983